MGRDRHGQRFCDECGHMMDKAHRIERGHEYCSTCYPRVFIRRACKRCGGSTRAHRHLPDAEVVCAPCVRSVRQCQRCEQPLPRASKVVPGGHLCAACAPYGSAPSRCEGCQTMVMRLSSLPRLGITEKLCDRCRNRHTHRTCSQCRRYRKLHSFDAEGAARCASCVEGRERLHVCPTCKAEVAGAGAGQCRPCLVQQKLHQDAAILPLALEHDWAKELYTDLAGWLMRTCTSTPRLPATYAKQAVFFARLDVVFAHRHEITAARLLKHFEVAQLRRHLLAVKFLQAKLGFAIEESEKTEAVEQARIHDKLYATRHELWATVLAEYGRWHVGKGTTARSLRQYLTAAEHLLRTRGDLVYGQAEVDQTLRQHPGSRTSLSVFVRFASERYGWLVSMPPSTARLSKKSGMVVRLSKWLDQVDTDGVQEVSTLSLERVLRAAFGLSPTALADTTADETGTWLQVLHETDPIKVPEPLRAIAREWRRRHAETTEIPQLRVDSKGARKKTPQHAAGAPDDHEV